MADLFENRYLFVRHQLSKTQRRLLQHLTRGLPQLRRLREIMDEVYRLFDRRRKTRTALKKLAKLRRRVRRFDELSQALNKLNSPTLEKALVFLDDKLLGSTSNADPCPPGYHPTFCTLAPTIVFSPKSTTPSGTELAFLM